MEEKVKKVTPWKVIKWTLLSISILVYVLAMWRIFISCDADVSDDIILTKEEAKDFENLDIDYPLYNCQPTAWTDGDQGHMQIKNIYYLEPIEELQLTVRYRISRFAEDPFYYKARVVEADESERLIEDIERHTESRFDYKYVRLCIDDIIVDEGEKVTRTVERFDKDGNKTTEEITETVGGNKVYLDIYSTENDELLYTFLVAGKTVSPVRTRRNKVDIRIID